MSFQEQNVEQNVDLTSLTKPKLLEEAISLKIKLNANKYTETIMSVFRDEMMELTTKVTILENTVNELQDKNDLLFDELEYCINKNKRLSSNYSVIYDEIYYLQKSPESINILEGKI